MRVKHRGLGASLALAVLVVTLVTPGPASAAGFSIFEAGSRATAVGGAFVARADDLSAMFYNPAGFASNDKLSVMVGVTLIMPRSTFDGGNPYPGAGYSADQKNMIFFPPNFYVAMPISKGVNIGLGTWFPFGLSTAWDDPDNFRGRFQSQRIDLRQYAMSLQLSAQLAPWLSIGGGPELRVGDVKLNKNAPVFNPYSQRYVDAAHVDIIQDGFSSNLGFAAGVQLKPTDWFSLGGSYHSAVKQSYKGNASFSQRSTGYADLDAAVAKSLPFGENVDAATSISFPSVLSLGASVNLSRCVTLDLAAVQTKWSSFDQTVITFATSPSGKNVPASVLPHNWSDSWSYRAGASWLLPSERVELAAGIVYDQTPQPDYDVSPLLPDSNRTGYSIGASFRLGKATWVDFSNLFLFFHERTVSQGQKDNYYGTYKTYANLTVLNLRSSF